MYQDEDEIASSAADDEVTLRKKMEIFSKTPHQEKSQKLKVISLICESCRMNHSLCESLLRLCRSAYMFKKMQILHLKFQLLM